ncbi:MAG: hypothetical protein H6Q90_4443 [Deltaproteobacteria bacterium]|nr:hypothetical protein [Deltaproteobacteria bacterium]
MTKAGDTRGYKRSWKNLLINKKYQLRFTLFMVGLSALLMGGLGFWIMVVANETTKVSITSERGKRCEPVPTIEAPHEEAPAPVTPMKLPDGPDGAGSQPVRPGGSKINVTLDEMEVPKPQLVIPAVPKDFGAKVVEHWTCEVSIASKVVALERGRMQILLALIATGLLLVFGLAAYGIKMTHRVAGPLFKVQLYLAKMRSGRFDKVYNLRKGDQLVSFYDHFKLAHAGIVKMQESDIERMTSVIAAAEAAGAGDHPSVVAMREMLARKKQSLE